MLYILFSIPNDAPLMHGREPRRQAMGWSLPPTSAEGVGLRGGPEYILGDFYSIQTDRLVLSDAGGRRRSGIGRSGRATGTRPLAPHGRTKGGKGGEGQGGGAQMRQEDRTGCGQMTGRCLSIVHLCCAWMST